MWHHHPHHHHCIVPFCPGLSFTCRVDLLSANIPNISLLRGSWDKVSRVEEIKIIYQSQPLEGYKYTCTMGHSFCGKTEVLEIFKRDLFNTLPLENGPTAPYTAPAALKVRQPIIEGTHLLPWQSCWNWPKICWWIDVWWGWCSTTCFFTWRTCAFNLVAYDLHTCWCWW